MLESKGDSRCAAAKMLMSLQPANICKVKDSKDLVNQDKEVKAKKL